jgi:hypothetical protein
MNRMSLITAFRTARFLTPSMSAVERLAANVAAVRLHEEIRAIANRILRMDEANRDLLVNNVLQRFVRAGPRGERALDPVKDEEVSRFLVRCLQNEEKSWQRSESIRVRRHVSPKEADEAKELENAMQAGATILGMTPTALDDAGLDDETAARRGRQLAVVTDARNYLYDCAIPSLCTAKEQRSKGAGKRLEGTLALLRQAAAGEVRINDVVRAELSAESAVANDAVFAKRRNAYDTQFRRAREAVLDWLDHAEDVSRDLLLKVEIIFKEEFKLKPGSE